jgi:hypothetical protein
MEEKCREIHHRKGIFKWPCNLVAEGEIPFRMILQDSILEIH